MTGTPTNSTTHKQPELSREETPTHTEEGCQEGIPGGNDSLYREQRGQPTADQKPPAQPCHPAYLFLSLPSLLLLPPILVLAAALPAVLGLPLLPSRLAIDLAPTRHMLEQR